MALSHILDAVSASADEQIEALRESYAKRTDDLRKNTDEQINELESMIKNRVKEECHQWKTETETRATRDHNAQMLAAKRKVIDEIYGEALEKIRNLSEEQIESLFVDWVSSLPATGGVIHPAKQHETLIGRIAQERSELNVGDSIDVVGGFRFESDKEERDYTFEGIIRMILRPRTERLVFDRISN